MLHNLLQRSLGLSPWYVDWSTSELSRAEMQNEVNVQRSVHVLVYLLIWPLGWRLRCLRDAVCPLGKRLAVPASSRSGGTGLLDLANDKGAEVWLRRFRPRPSLSIILDLAFLLIVLGVGKRLPKSWKGLLTYRRWINARNMSGDLAPYLV